MHIRKEKDNRSIGGLLRHHDRKREEARGKIPANRENVDIDRDRTRENYDFMPEGETAQERYKERMRDLEDQAPRAIRKDAVRLDLIVVTLPEGLQGKGKEVERTFFEACDRFFQERYGAENRICSAVHVDERTPHMHYGFTPVYKDDQGRERLSHDKVVPRREYQELHDKLQDYTRDYLRERGYTHDYSLVRDKEARDLDRHDREQKNLSMKDYKRMKQAQERELRNREDRVLEREKAVQEKSARIDRIEKEVQRNQLVPAGREKGLTGKERPVPREDYDRMYKAYSQERTARMAAQADRQVAEERLRAYTDDKRQQAIREQIKTLSNRVKEQDREIQEREAERDEMSYRRYKEYTIIRDRLPKREQEVLRKAEREVFKEYATAQVQENNSRIKEARERHAEMGERRAGDQIDRANASTALIKEEAAHVKKGLLPRSGWLPEREQNRDWIRDVVDRAYTALDRSLEKEHEKPKCRGKER